MRSCDWNPAFLLPPSLQDWLPEGRAIYRRRQAVVEPVFGQIQERRGFRRFLLRGLARVEAEWKMICATHNLLKLFQSGGKPQSA